METQVSRLVEKTWARFQETFPDQRLMIAISGIPGSGKTTLAAEITRRLNEKWHSLPSSTALPSDTLSPSTPSTPASSSPNSSEDIAKFVPMDGFHFSRSHLDQMPDPAQAHARRGAAFTFDAPAFLHLVQSLREPLISSIPSKSKDGKTVPETKTIHAPSFDHALKDPVPDSISIPASARIIIFEGNYLSLGTGADEWREAASLMDELWFVKVSESVARERLIKRHVASGVAPNEEEAAKRVDENDLLNGREIVRGRVSVDEVIESREDEAWKADQ